MCYCHFFELLRIFALQRIFEFLRFEPLIFGNGLADPSANQRTLLQAITHAPKDPQIVCKTCRKRVLNLCGAVASVCYCHFFALLRIFGFLRFEPLVFGNGLADPSANQRTLLQSIAHAQPTHTSFVKPAGCVCRARVRL